MSDFKRTWPKKTNRGVSGFFFGAEALGLSLEATGLAAYIYSWDGDDIDTDILDAMFPGRDLSGPLTELAGIGLIDILPDGTPPIEPVIVENEVRHKRPGTIYLVEGAGRYKIGISQGSAKKRLAGLQTGSPVRLQLIDHAMVRDCSRAEQLAHGLLMRFHLHGEWFECTEDQARTTLETVIEAVGTAK